MTDQFSQEYIDYILSDEAKGLQQGHILAEGDRYLEPAVSMVVAIVDAVDMTVYSADLASVIWLPTLWDLLRIIEGAGRRVEEIMYELDRGTYYGGLDELMMRAAKLAVRALEGDKA